MNSKLIEEYRNGILEYFFTIINKEDNRREANSFYCYKTISKFSEVMAKDLFQKDAIKDIDKLNEFNNITVGLLYDMLQFFIAVYKDGDISDIDTCKNNIDGWFRRLNSYGQLLKKYSNAKDYSTVLKIKDYCLYWINETEDFLYNNMFIDIKKCPFDYDFRKLISTIENSATDDGINLRLQFKPSPNSKIIDKKNALTLAQIALKYAYENRLITIDNADDIAAKYGYTSGKKLLQHFTFYYARSNRKAKPNSFTKTTVKNKIKLFESVFDILRDDVKKIAGDELTILRGFLKEFE